MYFTREIESQLITQLEKKEIIVLTGMRRTGKTSLLKHLFDSVKSGNKVFFDLQNLLEQKIFDEIDYNNIIKNLRAFKVTTSEKMYLFIDEIQFMPKVTNAIKYLYDHFNIKFVVTGSSSFYLKNLFPESLAGRKVVFELFPLSFNEFLSFKGTQSNFIESFEEKREKVSLIENELLKKSYDEYLKYGGFPQVVLEENEEQKKMLLKDIFSSFFQIDILNLADFKKIDAFKKMIDLLFERTGAKLDISKLASLIGVSRDTVYSYLNLLEGTFFIHLITPFTMNKDREISGTKKLYMCDTGMINLFSNVSSGSLLENSVFNNLKRYGTVNYFQKRSGIEIDFILNKKTAIEVKTTGDKNDIEKLKKLSQGINLTEYYLVAQNYIEHENYIPAYLI